VVVDDHDDDFVEDFDVAPTFLDVGHAAGVEDQVKSLQKEEQLDLEVREHVKKGRDGNKHDFSQ
jgi:arylsulfatase A-like enzyme